MSNYPTIRLSKGREISTKRRHPWIFSGGVAKVDEDVVRGDVVTVEAFSGDVLGTAHFHKSSIMGRILSFNDEKIDVDFYKNRFDDALRYRKHQLDLPNNNTNCYRLIHGEGDGLPGLIIDIYNKTAVVQCHSLGMAKQLREIIQALQLSFGDDLSTIFNKSKEVTNHYPKIGVIWGAELSQDTVLENGHSFLVNWEEGQKTGFFLDQRNNRDFVGKMAQGKKVLNLFSYSGGFSIYALNQGATYVESVDVSEKAIDLLDQNLEINTFEGKSKGLAMNVKEYLTQNEDLDFDIIIVDPPAFAKSQKKRHNAIQAYTRLNAQVFSKCKSGTTIFTFSCSQVVDSKLFKGAILSAGIETNRQIRIIKQLSQGGDHPINLFHPEGHYLKGLMLEIN
jgi:23S rRNA (cytosine1962-C5)-methyltransferase